MKKFLFLVALVLSLGISANADTVGLTPSEADNLFHMSFSGTQPSFIDTGVGTYTVAWEQSVNGLNSETIGINFLGGRGVAGDFFSVTIFNTNENAWDFTIGLNGVDQPFVSIPNGGSHTFTVLLAAPVTSFTLTVRGNLPIAGVDRTAEFAVASVPEPASMLLLGTGLIGAAAGIRRRCRKI